MQPWEASPSVEGILAQAVPFASDQLAATAALGLAAGRFPNSTDFETGQWDATDASTWTAGYLSGCYWKAYALTGDPSWADLATAQLPGLTLFIDEHGKLTHDYMGSFGEALAAAVPGAPLQEYEGVIKRVAGLTADRFSEKVGCFRSWGATSDTREFKVITDTMATMHLMVLASRMPGGKAEWADMALQHARTVAQNHFRQAGLVWPDGSTYHLLKYDPRTGKLRWQGTHQGYADNSTWSRGQAWALVGFTHFYNATRDPGMLATACRAADTYLRLLGESGEEDWVPLWDFQAPASQASKPASCPPPFKDTSAAAIAASGLLRLAQLSSNQTYAEAGAAMLNSLTASYLGSTAPAPLALASVLRNGSWTVPGGHHSTGLIWGDYYFLDALAVLHGSSSSEGLPPAGEPAPAPLPAAAAQPTLEIS